MKMKRRKKHYFFCSSVDAVAVVGRFKFEALKHQTKITPNTDKENVQNIICLPKDSRRVKTHAHAGTNWEKKEKQKEEGAV